MKPDQLNRLIKVNTRMQPWFLRNTSELYESAVRSYYERGHSSHNRHPRFRTENAGPLRRIKRAEAKPSANDIYPRSHIMQADQASAASNSNSGQFLYSMMQANRSRSMSFTAARPYASVYGQSSVRRVASSSCSSGRSSESSRTEFLVGSLRKNKAKRERQSRSMRKSRDSKEESHLVDMGMFSGRSMSMPSRPSASVLGSVAMMPPSRQHHIAAMAKSSLAQGIQMPRSDGDSLMPVDAALKRRISVLGKLDGGRKRSGLGPLGSGATRNGSTTAINGQQPTEMRHRFQTLGDRIKQFEYIQFADGPVATYAFNRSQQRPINTSIRDSPRSRIEKSSDTSINGTTNSTRSNATTRRMEVRQQPRQLSFHNVLHANYRQRSRSLESGAVQLRESLESIARPATPLGPRGFDGATRGSSLDSSSRTSFRPSNSTITWDNSLGRYEEELGRRSVHDFGYAKSSEDTSCDWDVNPGEDWPKYPRSSSPCGKGLMSNVAKSDNVSVGNANASSQNWAIPSGSATKLRSIEGKAKEDTLESTTVNSEHGKANSNSGSTSRDTSQANSQAASVHDEPNRATLAPVRRVHLQQKSLQNQSATKVDEPKREDLPLSPLEVKDTIKEKARERVKNKQLLESLQDKPRVTKVTSNQVSRSSHRSFLHPAKDDDVTAANVSKKSQSHPKLGKKPERKANQKREDRTPAQVKGANQLLVASASQVSAYKRAFRTQQQIRKAEILQQQAQHLQESPISPTAIEGSKQTAKLQSHQGSIQQSTSNRTNVRTLVRRSAASSGGKASRPAIDCNGKTHEKGNGAAIFGGGGGRGVGVGGAVRRAAKETLTVAAQQQQQSRNGNSLLGYRRETVNRAAAALLQRRDADEPLSQLQLQLQSQSPSASQSTQQRRQFHCPHPPWRPSY
ncbi:GM21518 [Drosophila sechellia]|uniref:GM21518 n=1 Tax=Drosophila sechellia TaxID=7238 RepID=B4IJV0_DROSE|nr:GM21518 [Drosophila sechellia]